MSTPRLLKAPRLLTSFACALLAASACDPDPQPASDTAAPQTVGETDGAPVHATRAQPRAHAPSAPDLHEEIASKAVAPDAKASFEQMLELIDAKYVDAELDEDRLYTAAMRGVMQELIQMPGHEINSLLSPKELARLLEGTQGQIVGVGVMIEQVGGQLVVRGTIEGGPAAKAGLKAGDRILSADGVRLDTLALGEAVDKIRGEVGTQVELFVQRDIEEWTVPVTRASVKVDSVSAALMPGGVGYLRLTGFAKDTGTDVHAKLDELAAQGMQRLVLDLRACPGGLLNSALETAELFLAPGLRIVSIHGREGNEHIDASEAGAYDRLPLVVLIGPKTASGAEILSGALQENARALIVGQTSFGKGSVEAIHELDNGWALKLSSARFLSPNDTPRQNHGVEPDFPIAGDDGPLAEVSALVAQPDAQLRAALHLLGLEAG